MDAIALAAVLWTAPAECPSAEEARAQLQDALSEAPDASVEVDISPAEPGYVMRVEVIRAGMTLVRSVPLESCAQAIDAAAVVVALAVDAMPQPEEPEPEPVVPEPVVPEPEPVVPEPEVAAPRDAPEPPRGQPADVLTTDPPPEPTPQPQARVPWRIGVAGGLGVAAVGDLGAQARADVGFTFDRWVIDLSVDHWIRRTERAPAPPDAGVRLSLSTARIGAGFRPSAGRVSFPLTGFVGGGVIRGAGVDVPGARTTFSGLALLGLSAAARISIADRWAVFAQAEGFFSAPGRAFALDDGVFIRRIGGFGGLFLVGITFGPGAR